MVYLHVLEESESGHNFITGKSPVFAIFRKIWAFSSIQGGQQCDLTSPFSEPHPDRTPC